MSRRVVAIHGAVVNGAAWRPLRRALGARFAVEAPDLPGHGARIGERFDLPLAVDELVARCRAGEPPIVCGDSLGGYLALLVAARASVAAVVAGGCTFPLHGWWSRIARATDVPLPDRVGRLAVRAIARGARVRGDGDAVLAAGIAPAQRSLTLRALFGIDYPALAGTIVAPLTFIDGAFDPARIGAHAYRRAAPRARFVVVPNAGHGVGFLRPAAMAREIARIATPEER
ncbi:lysophospholipase [Vulcanimicrobium alpinum]|uniref:Lysophospholipase n=1 Tax=Vulcanimicrobium alpinum TaxID=3016050 RepID=A0AAN1XZU2_UNVUL|nr:alpha/beta hydrolase [Vulcanimicrobium alpinum]BDE07478.1 lysophospholipase [Vulcanimicrobium alpinum]